MEECTWKKRWTLFKLFVCLLNWRNSFTYFTIKRLHHKISVSTLFKIAISYRSEYLWHVMERIRHPVHYVTKSYINSRILCYYNREWIKPKPLLLLPPPFLVLDYIILIYNFYFRSNEGDNSSLSSSVQYAYHFYIVFMLWGIIQVFLW